MKVNYLLLQTIGEKVKLITDKVKFLGKKISAIIIFILLLVVPFGNKTSLRAEEIFKNRTLPNNYLLPDRDINNYPPPNTPYILGAGDRININIFEVEKFSGEYLVLVDGTISLPLLGNINVRGLTLSQASEVINRRYAAFLKNPLTTITLVTPRFTKVAVVGEVNSPGSYQIKFGNNPFPSLTDVIKLAGGLTTAADLHSVYIRRIFQGAEQIYTVNLSELFNKGNLDRDVFLRDGDEIIISTKKELKRQESLESIDGNLQSE